MNGKTVRSRSNSPSSSVDSIYRKKLNKKPIKSQKSREDVQVFTSLPPKVEGEIKCYLKLQISRINLVNEPAKTNQPVANNARQNRNIKSNLKDKNPPSDTKNGNLIARCVWWGEEDTTGAVFRPKVFGTNCLDNKISQTLARYMVRSGPKQFSAYLNDMKTLDIDIIDDQSKKTIAKVRIMQISELTPSNSIKGYFPAFDSSQIKIADVYVSIQFESVHKNSVDKKRPSDQSENSRPVTPTPASNINDFNMKYDQFEKQQLDLAKKTEENKSKDIFKKLPNSLLFNSNCYVNTLNEDMMEKSKNPIIQNLIERGLKLKQEMSQSAISIEPKGLDLKPVQSDAATFYSIISNKTDLFDDYLEEDNDVSRLSDPLNDHQILSNILYSQESPNKNFLTEDQELKNLLEPPDLFTRLIKNGEPKIDPTVSRLSLFSLDQIDDENCRHNPRVSFEVQSSDGEGSICNDRYIDILSPQRISLLNLIQISKISIDKLIFFNSSMVQNIFDQLNRTREPSPCHQLATKSSNSKSKPPLACKKFDMASLFFIEYQFPVMGNIMEESTNPMSSQVMRVVSKKIDKKETTNECSVVFDHQADYSVLFNSHSLDSWWRSHASFKIYIRPFSNQSNVKTIAISNASSGPQLIGYARFSLRNILKSKNFKLLKRLAVKDLGGKRIGTLNVSLELSSDLEEFLINLKRLKNSETLPVQKAKFEKEQERVQEPVMTIQPYEAKKTQEDTVPIKMFLSINEARSFVSDFEDPEKIYLISRLFWNKEKIKFEASKNFNWTVNLGFMINRSIISNMKNNFMIIEAWKKNCASVSDSLVGTIKLPLHEFYLKMNDFGYLREHLVDATKMPLTGIDGWISVFDLFTGQKVGEINILMSLGSQEQIINAQKTLFDKSKIKNSKKNVLLEHFIKIIMDDLKIHPVHHEHKNENIFAESEYNVKYSFPSTPHNSGSLSTSIFNSHILSKRFGTKNQCKIEHRLILPSEILVQSELVNLFQSQPNNSVKFEIWSHGGSRERLIGHGELGVDKLLSIIQNSSLEVNNRSFIIPLLRADDEKSVKFSDFKYDRYIGQLLLTIEYKKGKTIDDCVVIPRQLPDPNDVQMSIGVLRANGLKKACIDTINSDTFYQQNFNVYVKFSLKFLNRPYDFRQTRVIACTPNGHSLDFFDYFDINCPLLSKYDSSSKKTLSLAEQIELGQIVFEVWSRNSDSYIKNSSDVLLGSCTVNLEPLLENRIGVRGWMPIKAVTEPSQQEIGNLELTIRFVKADDFTRIIRSAKEIGWKPSSDFIIKETIPDNSKSNKVPKYHEICLNTDPVEDVEPKKNHMSAKNMVKCLVEIEKAIHLPKVYEEKSTRCFEPDAFVSFNTNMDNMCDITETKVCSQSSSPIWNFQSLTNVDSDFFIDELKYFVFKVWHKNPESNGLNKLLGCVSVDLKPLMCGLSHLSGWYNIQDSVGNSQGQLKINILPQENLFEIKEAYLKRKKNRSQDEKKSSLYISKHETSSISSFSNQPQSLQSTQSLTSFRSESVLSTRSDNVQEIIKDKNELKIGLLEKLSELDQLNKMLKQRLEIKNEKVNFAPQPAIELIIQSEIKIEDQIVRNEKIIEKIEIVEKEEKIEIKKDDKKSVDQNEEVKFEPIRNLLDSFWAESSDGKSAQYDIVNLIESDKIENLPPSCPINNQDDKDESESNQMDENLNDTDLDQTGNLNASYEIIPCRQQNTQSPQIDTYEIVENVIDCNQVDLDDEKCQIEDLNEIDNNKSLLVYGTESENDDNDLNNNNDSKNEEENLTVVIPEELNKISDEVSENRDIEGKREEKEENRQVMEIDKNPNQTGTKSKDSALKIPNYFLPRDDLEKTMKQLHFNYVNIKEKQDESDNESEKESEKNEQTLKTRVKSTDILSQNKSLLKHDLSRINKIFYSKFN